MLSHFMVFPLRIIAVLGTQWVLDKYLLAEYFHFTDEKRQLTEVR